MIDVVVNGDPRRLEEARLDRALECLLPKPPGRGTAVALNGSLVPRADWPATTLSAGDRLEIVRAVGGG